MVTADQVTANIGGDLLIQSLRDTDNYNNKSQQVSGSIMVGAGGGGSLNLSKTRINSDYQSVTQQSAIRTGSSAGDGGFQVNVGGNTTLNGGAITSTQAAVDSQANSFSTGTSGGGTLTTTDIQNTASYSAESHSIGTGTGGMAGITGAGIGSDSGSANSTTLASISGMAGNKDARTGDAESGIAKVFDQEAVTNEVNAQVTITSEFGRNANQAVKSFAQDQRDALRKQLSDTTDPAAQAQLEQAIDDVGMQERALNILLGAFTGLAGTAVTKETLGAAADQMRSLMIEDSKKFAGVVDSTGRVLSNISGQSDGVNGDGYKIGGTRLDLDLLCGATNERCTFVKNTDGSIDEGAPVTFIGQEKPDGTRETLTEFLATPQGKKMIGTTGGIQGQQGTLFGMPYAPGSWQDKMIEAFAGTHDFIGGKASGLYDEQGNAERGRSELTTTLQNRWSEVALIPSAPFAAAQGMSPEVWAAIAVLLKAVK